MILLNLFFSVLCFPVSSLADEGMWTLDNLPRQQLKSRYGFEASGDWLTKVQLSSLRMSNGCSASFISEKGLVMTNHHCARGCVQQLSSAKKDYIYDGFLAKNLNNEKRCPALEVNRLVEVSDMTREVNKATRGLEGKAYSEARKAQIAQLEKNCAAGDSSNRCDMVMLYNGGQYMLYKYQRYQDVRLVFAPENSIASFGGDPDNFNFPRYSLDMAFLRVYENDKPIKNPHYFRWTKKPLKAGDLTFITGHPGTTKRLLTLSQLEFERDVTMVDELLKLSERRGLLVQYQKLGREEERTSRNSLLGTENRFKAYRGRLQALQDRHFFGQLVKAEKDLRYRVQSNPWYKKKYGHAWREISKAVDLMRNKKDEITYVAFSFYGSRLFSIARTLVRAADELPKPNTERLREFSESKLPQLKQSLYSQAPIYPKLEMALMEFELTKMREALRVDHPFVKKVLGRQSPAALAKKLVSQTQLAQISRRRQLFEGGKQAIEKSKDPMILMARALDSDSRTAREFYETKIEAVIDKNSERVAQAKFDILGTDTYPDATFSLRLSYGQVKGYSERGQAITPFTFTEGLYERATGSEPFALPSRWKKLRSSLNPKTPFNFVTTNDIIGGNSGSPVINRDAEIIGLVFDGNIHSLGGAYGFDESQNRAVSVHSSIMLESLSKVYNFDRLVKEISP